jgi:hypothetical protein
MYKKYYLSWARSSYLMGDNLVLYRAFVVLDSLDSRTILAIHLVGIVTLGRLSFVTWPRPVGYQTHHAATSYL